MKKFLLVLCVIFLFVGENFSQKEANVWAFGLSNGIDFNSGTAVAILTSMFTTEGCSSVCDSVGSLLFYTNGMSVWDKNGIVMPNGTDLFGHDTTSAHHGYSSTQGATIIKKPDSDSLYFIFTASAQGKYLPYCYSIVDMSLNGGLGDVTSKNIVLLANSSEKLTAVNHRNQNDVWVITHPLGSNQFHSFLLTGSGISSAVITSIDTAYSVSHGCVGAMKASHNGKKVISCEWGTPNRVALYDFNDSTGVLSNSMVWSLPGPGSRNNYGAEFSPNDSFLYISCAPGNYVYQYDISSNNFATILSSEYDFNLPSRPYQTGNLQLGPDGRIYLNRAGLYNYALSVINAPNYPGALCSFTDSSFVLLWTDNKIPSMPNFNQSIFKNAPNLSPLITNAGNEVYNEENIHVFPNPAFNSINVNFNSNSLSAKVFLYDIAGRLIFEKDFKTSIGSNTLEYDISFLDKGVYILKVNQQSVRFIK